MSSKTKTTTTKEDATPALLPKLRFPEFRGTEGWDAGFLGDICQPQQWATISSNDLVNEGYPVYGANGFIGYYTDFNHEFETVAVTCRGSTCGEVSLIPPKSYITGNSMCLDEIDAVQNSYHFVYHLLKHRGFNDIISGSAQPQIVGNAIKRLRIAIPRKPEQQEIAECLSSVDELMAAQARKVDALKTHKKGLMQQLFPREGETQPRLRFPAFQNAGEWEPKTLVDACRMQAGKFVAAADIKEQSASDLFSCYGGNGLRGFTATHTHDGVYPLIGRQGALCGNIKLASGRFHATEHAVVATPNQGVEVVWLYYLLDLLNLNRFATGQAQPGLSVDVLEKVPVTIPKDEREQQRIASCLSSLDALTTAETQKLEALKTHKKGLMQQLFPSPEEVEA